MIFVFLNADISDTNANFYITLENRNIHFFLNSVTDICILIRYICNYKKKKKKKKIKISVFISRDICI